MTVAIPSSSMRIPKIAGFLLVLAGTASAAQIPTISLADAAALDMAKASIIDVRYAGDYRCVAVTRYFQPQLCLLPILAVP